MKIAFIFKQINWPYARCHKNVNAFCFAYFAQYLREQQQQQQQQSVENLIK